MHTAYAAQIGPISFEYRGAGVVVLPALHGHTLRTIDGALLISLVEGDRIFLALDHRLEPVPSEPAYVELWQPVTPAEAPLHGLFVIASTDGHDRPYVACPSLESLALRLQPVSW